MIIWIGIDFSGLATLVPLLVVYPAKFGGTKKHVFGSSVGCRGGGCQTLACALGVLTYV